MITGEKKGTNAKEEKQKVKVETKGEESAEEEKFMTENWNGKGEMKDDRRI